VYIYSIYIYIKSSNNQITITANTHNSKHSKQYNNIMKQLHRHQLSFIISPARPQEYDTLSKACKWDRIRKDTDDPRCSEYPGPRSTPRGHPAPGFVPFLLYLLYLPSKAPASPAVPTGPPEPPPGRHLLCLECGALGPCGAALVA